jgi:hypothetical protein
MRIDSPEAEVNAYEDPVTVPAAPRNFIFISFILQEMDPKDERKLDFTFWYTGACLKTTLLLLRLTTSPLMMSLTLS